jgi:hypothetical protein
VILEKLDIKVDFKVHDAILPVAVDHQFFLVLLPCLFRLIL